MVGRVALRGPSDHHGRHGAARGAPRGTIGDVKESSGSRLVAQHRWLAVGGVVVVGLSLLVSITTDDYLYLASILATLVVLVPVLLVLQRNHQRRRAIAAASGAFGATCNVYFENIKEMPRFRTLLGEFRMPWWTKLPSTLPPLQRSVMGGAIRIDRHGVVWTPSSYRQRKGMPTLSVPLEDVESVNRRALLAIGRGGALEVRLRDGSEWLLTLQDSDAAVAHLKQLGCRTNAS